MGWARTWRRFNWELQETQLRCKGETDLAVDEGT